MSKSEDKFDSDIYINDRNAPRGVTWQAYILKVNGFSHAKENQRIKFTILSSPII